MNATFFHFNHGFILDSSSIHPRFIATYYPAVVDGPGREEGAEAWETEEARAHTLVEVPGPVAGKNM
jgi:hypothetical protein